MVRKMKRRDIPLFKQEVLDILPITQADMWKTLDISIRNGSDLAKIMLEEGLITRRKERGQLLLEKMGEDAHTMNNGTENELKKKEDIESLRQDILKILPMVQSDIRKSLGIDGSTCSHIISDMVKENLITKKRLDKTFLIERIYKNESRNKEKNMDHTAMLSNKNRFSPCCGCNSECNASTCVSITQWLME